MLVRLLHLRTLFFSGYGTSTCIAGGENCLAPVTSPRDAHQVTDPSRMLFC